MRRLIVTTAALALTLGSASAIAAEEATPTDATSSSDSQPGSVTVEVSRMTGMEGLELVGKVWGPMVRPGGGDPGVEIFHLAIDDADVSASGSTVAPPGDYYTRVFAGPPPCDADFMPVCGASPQETGFGVGGTEFFCMTGFDVRPDEDIRVSLAGLPEMPEGEMDDPLWCPVSLWERGPKTD